MPSPPPSPNQPYMKRRHDPGRPPKRRDPRPFYPKKSEHDGGERRGGIAMVPSLSRGGWGGGGGLLVLPSGSDPTLGGRRRHARSRKKNRWAKPRCRDGRPWAVAVRYHTRPQRACKHAHRHAYRHVWRAWTERGTVAGWGKKSSAAGNRHTRHPTIVVTLPLTM